MDAREKSRATILESSKHKRVPILVMMPVNTFGIDSSGSPRIRKIKALTISLRALKLAGVYGIAVEIGGHNEDIYYRDKNGFSNDDYLTLGVDQLPLFYGRTAFQCYEDFMLSFDSKFDTYIGSVIEEISVGLGPSGELRYHAHPLGDGRWKFPGIGEFQCYDKYMMEDLKMAACKEGKPQRGDRDLKMLVATTVFHLVFLCSKTDRRAFFTIMVVSSLCFYVVLESKTSVEEIWRSKCEEYSAKNITRAV